MDILRAADNAAQVEKVLAGTGPAVRASWLQGPTNDANLDVAMVALPPGGATPPHIHVGGQVIVVTSGRGYVETNGVREPLRPGDIVVAPAGELHTHGADPDSPFAHLTVTTGGYRFPEPAA